MGVSMDEVFNTSRSTSARSTSTTSTVRPDLAGQRPGRRELPQADRGPQAVLKIRNRAGRDGPLRRDGERRDGRARSSCGTTCTPPPRSTASPAPGVSSGQAIARWKRSSARTDPQSMRMEWTELALCSSSRPATRRCIVFILAVVLVFLVLAAQYESWSLPLGGDPGRADVPALLGRGRADGVREDGHQHLHADRLHRARGPGLQERDPDRRVRQGPREEGVPRYQATLDACSSGSGRS